MNGHQIQLEWDYVEPKFMDLTFFDAGIQYELNRVA